MFAGEAQDARHGWKVLAVRGGHPRHSFSRGVFSGYTGFMEAQEIQAVVFDLDGVLADSEGIHVLAWREICGQFGLSLDGLQLQDWVGYSDEALAEELLRKGRQPVEPEEFLRRKRSAYRRLISTMLAPYPGVLEALDTLGRLPLGLATSSARSEALPMLEILGLGERFQAVVTMDDVRQAKPAPDCYLKAAELLAAAPQRCLAVEDSPGGVLAARRAGYMVLGVTNTLPADKLAGADALFASTPQAIRWIKDRRR
jgi:HAD superfamily hydrolase (TIGR01509 family)